MPNLNYVGSLAQERIQMKSTTDVVVNTSTDIFNSVSVYIPSSFAIDNIVDWDDSLVTPEKPAVITVDVTNFTKIMKGALLTQWLPAFRQETNFELTMYLIVFQHTAGDVGNWTINDDSIVYSPLKKAFDALYSFSYLKVLFYPAYDGKDISFVPISQRFATMGVTLTKNTPDETISAGTYVVNDLNNNYTMTLAGDLTLVADGTPSANQTCTGNIVSPVVGFDPGTMKANEFFNGLDVPDYVMAEIVSVTNNYSSSAPNEMEIRLFIATAVVISEGSYKVTMNSGTSKRYVLPIAAELTVNNGDSVTYNLRARDEGQETAFAPGDTIPANEFAPNLPDGLQLNVVSVVNPPQVPTPVNVASEVFDLALALSELCRNSISLSWMMHIVKINYTDLREPDSNDECWIRYATRAEQLEAYNGLTNTDRKKFFWGCLYKQSCINTTIFAHSEEDYIIADVLGAWFAQKNTSGTYIGNKLSLLRLSGTRIKPLGWPSWLDSSINENDADGHQQLRDMNVGFLQTIADDTPQECELSMCRGVGDIDKGIPMSMQMIGKYVDYTCSMDIAKMITDKGTLTDPVMTDEDAYKRIQATVMNNLSKFAGTNGRITGITMMFPSFDKAKVSKTAISAASAWKAWYKDDLDTVQVSGGIIAE